ncbi:MAG: HAD family hydrolase [candidate division Zixibacteria bacterium]|nr:HAD family hydrolase [candidate division Zixibacteria bacterium]
MKKRLKAVLFDMGSTLIEFENYTWDVLARLSAEKGYEFLKDKNVTVPNLGDFSKVLHDEFVKAKSEIEADFKEMKFEKVIFDFFTKLNLSTSDGVYGSFLEVYYEPIADQLTLVDGAEKILKFFKEENLKIGLISNTIFPERYHLRELKRFRLYSYLDAHFFSSQVGVRKPHPKIFQLALEKLQVDPSEAVFVGDRLKEDVGGAQNVGMKGILKYHQGRDYTVPVTPDAQVMELKDLPEVVFELF